MLPNSRLTKLLINLPAVTLCACFLLYVSPALADDTAVERGSAADAQAMVAQAIVLYDEKGVNAAFERFNENPAPDFKRLDLYLFVINVTDSKLVAHALSRSRIGLDTRELIDPDGINIGQAIMDAANPDGTWVDYQSRDPVSGNFLPKSSWVVLHDKYIFGCGIYVQ